VSQRNVFSSGVILGFYLTFPSVELTEFMGYLGFDYVLIDAEHHAFDLETVQCITRAAELTGMMPMVRVPTKDSAVILSYLETGIVGIVVPHLVTAEDARQVVNTVKYPPEGTRGAGSTTRAAHFGLTQGSKEYFASANRQTLVLGMVEDEEGIAHLPEILDVEGIDGMAVGRGDLALSMGYPGQTSHPEVQRLVTQANALIASSDKALGMLATSAEDALEAAGAGAAYVTLSLSTVLRRAGRQYLDQVRQSLETN
jgi:2-keto-3-deoxy-L-rhamnonate aldolase RhmA